MRVICSPCQSTGGESFVKKGGTIWIISQEITTWHWLLLDTEGIRIFRLYLSSVRLYYTAGNIKIQREDSSSAPIKTRYHNEEKHDTNVGDAKTREKKKNAMRRNERRASRKKKVRVMSEVIIAAQNRIRKIPHFVIQSETVASRIRANVHERVQRRAFVSMFLRIMQMHGLCTATKEERIPSIFFFFFFFCSLSEARTLIRA